MQAEANWLQLLFGFHLDVLAARTLDLKELRSCIFLPSRLRTFYSQIFLSLSSVLQITNLICGICFI